MDESESKMFHSEGLAGKKEQNEQKGGRWRARAWPWLPAGAALLHHLGAVEARQFAESVVAVDDGPLHDLSVAYQEAGL